MQSTIQPEQKNEIKKYDNSTLRKFNQPMKTKILRNIFLTVGVLFASAQLLPAGTFITFDPTGSSNTRPTAIGTAPPFSFWEGPNEQPNGNVDGGTRTWNLTNTNWTNASGNVNTTWHQEGHAIFTTIDVPGSTFTFVTGINPRGDIVGSYQDATGRHGFMLSHGTFTTIDVPGSTFSIAYGINAQNDIVGIYGASGHTYGFLLSNGAFSTIDVPGSFETDARGINPKGDIVGPFNYNGGISTGYLLSNGILTTIVDPAPGTVFTVPQKINPRGDIVGAYSTFFYPNHGFLLSKGSFTTIDAPGAGFFGTWPTGINPKGDIVGYQDYTGADFVYHGFLLSKGSFTSIDVPGAIRTQAFDINPSGDIVGTYTDSASFHGFLLSK